MAQKIYQVDAFTNHPFKVNPAGVCILAESAEDSWMQNIAREMNLSETAFLGPSEDDFQLRWFTPAVEVSLCGHATLASAHILWQTGVLGKTEQARFHTLSGLLTADLKGDWIEMNFPAELVSPADPPAELLDALQVKPVYTGKNRFDYLIEAEDEEIVRNLQPDFSLLSAVPTRGVIVTSRAGASAAQGFDFVSRFFAPAVGINEDPVTGSAHCALAPYWEKKLGKKELMAHQISAREGVLRVRVEGDRVIIGGQAVTVFEAELI